MSGDTCSFLGCGRGRTVREWCPGHYQQFRKGKVLRPLEERVPRAMYRYCTFPGCGRRHESRGLCSGHARQRRQGKELRPISTWKRGEPCRVEIDGEKCDRPSVARGLCQHHHKQELAGHPFRVIKSVRTSGEVMARSAEGHKRCLRCGSWKPETEYYFASHTSDSLQPDCIECYLWRNTRRKFKMEKDEYETRLASQGGGCAICGKSPSPGKRLSVDHDHSCCPGDAGACGNCNRGILCASCNSAPGYAGDDIDRLARMIEYLESWRKNK